MGTGADKLQNDTKAPQKYYKSSPYVHYVNLLKSYGTVALCGNRSKFKSLFSENLA